jgi:predicted esterase
VQALACAAVLAAASAPVHAATGPSIPPPPAPGPALLQEPPPDAPQLQNTGVWHAAPILVSGATAYRKGEFLYQDFLDDDHGANQQPGDPNDPRRLSAVSSQAGGTYTYPLDPRYGNNAADLVELRVKPLDDATAFRVTLNTLIDVSVPAFSIAIGGAGTVTHPFPYGANVVAPADDFLTVHPSPGGGMVADLRDAVSGAVVPGTPPVVHVDQARRQIEVDVSHAQWNPGTSVVRLAAGVGLWDCANGRYLLPQVSADVTHAGGSGGAPAPAAFFNVAFRTAEPEPQPDNLSDTSQHPAWWRDQEQGQALANLPVPPSTSALAVSLPQYTTPNLSAFHADVDFAKLQAEIDDDSGIPAGPLVDRILASHADYGQGFNPAAPACDCPDGAYLNQLQPYSVYVPTAPTPPGGWGLTVLLHGMGENYNKNANTNEEREFAARGKGSIVLQPEARGPAPQYGSEYAANDVFEAWADAARHYQLDPSFTDIAGYSEGGIGAFLLAGRFPDLFAKVQPTVGYANAQELLPSLRHVPVLMWNASTDEAVNEAVYGSTAALLDQLGYRYELDVFAPAEHTTLAVNDQFAPAADWLDSTTVESNPAHVTYVVDPSLDSTDGNGDVADHAYWLSSITLAQGTAPNAVDTTPGAPATATVDAVSYGFGRGDAPVSSLQLGSGTLSGGNLPFPLTYTRTDRTWGDEPLQPALDRLDLTLSHVGSLTVDVRRAHLDCNVDLHVSTDTQVKVALYGCGVIETFG